MTIPEALTLECTLAAVDRLAGTSDEAVALATTSAVLREFGFSAFLYAKLPDPRMLNEPQILLNGWPDAWTERYVNVGHYPHDPVAAFCLDSTQPFAWDEVPGRYWTSPRARQVVHEARAFGLNDGLCVPMHNALGAGGLSLSGERIEPIPGLKHLAALLAQSIRAVTERAQLAHVGGSRLTVRERDILAWVAHGKTVAGVAAMLGISDHTVGEHLKNVRHKLGSANNAHSIVRALQLGQLRL